MFLKVTRSKNRYYLQLVNSYREGDKVRHEVIANLGSHEELEENPLLLSLGHRLLRIAGEEVEEKEPLEMEELKRQCYGDVVYRRLWNKLAFDEMISQVLRRRKIKFDFKNALYLLVIDRLLCPRSKLATFTYQDRYLNIDQVKLEHEYRLLDVLAESQQKIEGFLFNRQKNLFNLQVDVVFYDITTFHFESIRADDLKDFGFSKAGKFNEVQVMLGLLVDTQGRPLGFDLYPGNTFEGDTLRDALDKLQNRFAIRKVIFVADRGLNSAANLGLIREANYEYIVASPVKRKSNTFKEKVLEEKGFVETVDPKDGQVIFKYKWMNQQVKYVDEKTGKQVTFEDRLLVSWTARRAERDFKNRERQLEKARKMIADNSSLTSKKGAARYLKTEGKQKVAGIDEEKIQKDQKWDGFHCIQTNADLTHEQVRENYNMLWKIEDSFRVMKSTMDTRPIFHWTPSRIKGHFVLSFLAFLLERNLEIKLKSNSIELSPEKLKRVLNSMELSHIRLNGKEYYLKAKAEQPAGKILKAFRIKAPANLTPQSELKIE